MLVYILSYITFILKHWVQSIFLIYFFDEAMMKLFAIDSKTDRGNYNLLK